MQGKRVFISGGGGVIGREMIPRLLRRGANVLVGDLKPRPGTLPAEVQYRQGDLNLISRAELEAFAPGVFIHLAATFERSTETYAFWEENFWHNVRLSHHLMTVAKDLPSLRRVVFASSYLIYDPLLYQFDEPQTRAAALREDHPIQPRNLTGMAKLAHEIELRFLEGFSTQHFSTVCARIFRGYGCNSRDVISRWIRALLRGEAITVYRPEGRFDYIYAADTGEGLIRLGESTSASGILNLGTGRSRRVAEVVDILRQHFPGLRLITADSDIPFEASEADITAYRAAVGWRPEYTLERAIPEMIAFERARIDRGRPCGSRPAANRGVLVSSASQKVPLVNAVRHAARKLSPEMRVVAGDLDPQAPARYVADAFWAMPPAADEQLPALIAGCREHGIGVVIPTRDGELQFWARHKTAFQAVGIEVVVSDLTGIEACRDKLAFASFGIPAGSSPDEVPAERYVVKERYGSGSKKIGLNLIREAALVHARELENPIFQPFIEGTEISVDAWLDLHHRVKGLVLRRREMIANGESRVTATFRDQTLAQTAAAVLTALKLRGPVVLQLLVDKAGKAHIIECNPRFGGASTAGIAAGLDPFYWSLLEAQGEDVSAYPFCRIPNEVRQVRVPADIYFYGPDF